MIEPTSSETNDNVQETEKVLGEALVIGEVERPLVVTVGENGQPLVVESLEGMIETSESNEEEKSEAVEEAKSEVVEENNSAQLMEDKNVQFEETLSVEQISELQKSIDDFTDKQAEEIMKQVFGE